MNYSESGKLSNQGLSAILINYHLPGTQYIIHVPTEAADWLPEH